MGRITRSGFGYGMTEHEALQDWLDSLTREYGGGSYQGGGQDLDEVTLAKLIQAPKPAVSAKNAKISKVAHEEGKWINGYKIVECVDKSTLLQSLRSDGLHPSRNVVCELAATLSEAKEKAKKLAMQSNCSFDVVPARLYQTKKGLLENLALFTAKPTGGKTPVLGKWQFEGEFRY